MDTLEYLLPGLLSEGGPLASTARMMESFQCSFLLELHLSLSCSGISKWLRKSDRLNRTAQRQPARGYRNQYLTQVREEEHASTPFIGLCTRHCCRPWEHPAKNSCQTCSYMKLATNTAKKEASACFGKTSLTCNDVTTQSIDVAS
eukprot:5180319-Amphidinium_carterae.1